MRKFKLPESCSDYHHFIHCLCFKFLFKNLLEHLVLISALRLDSYHRLVTRTDYSHGSTLESHHSLFATSFSLALAFDLFEENIWRGRGYQVEVTAEFHYHPILVLYWFEFSLCRYISDSLLFPLESRSKWNLVVPTNFRQEISKKFQNDLPRRGVAGSALRGTKPCRVMTHHNKSLMYYFFC